MELYLKAKQPEGLTYGQIEEQISASLEDKSLKKVLIIPPDFTRLFSNAGLITNIYYRLLTARGCNVDILPALGTHRAVTRGEAQEMFGDIPFEKFLVHNWRTDVVKLGEVPGEYLSQITQGLWTEPVSVEINRLVMNEKYDLIISVGQVVPHEVAGMSNQAKNFFVGVGGSDMINKAHMVGAVYGMERMMGRENTPVRAIFDYGMEHFLNDRPIMFALTVTTEDKGIISTHGLFIGHTRQCFLEAVALSKKKNFNFLSHGMKKCVVFLPAQEFKSTWLGNKAIYRTRMALEDGGELIIIAPGVCRFGEDEDIDRLIRKYGYGGRLKILEQYRENRELQDNMSAAAHLIHGSSDGRFLISYAAPMLTREEIEAVGFNALDYEETLNRYKPETLKYGYNTLPDGEEVFFIPNPALGLWIDQESFKKLN